MLAVYLLIHSMAMLGNDIVSNIIFLWIFLYRHQTGSAWKKIAVLLKKEDLPKLVTNVDALSSILSDCRTSNPVLYSAAKSWLFNEFLVDINLEDSSQVNAAY